MHDFIEAIKSRDLVKAKKPFGAIMAEMTSSYIAERRKFLAESVMIEGEEEDDKETDTEDKGDRPESKDKPKQKDDSDDGDDDDEDEDLDESAGIKVGDKIKLDPKASGVPVSNRFKGAAKVLKVETVKFASGNELRYHIKDQDGFDMEVRGDFVVKA